MGRSEDPAAIDKAGGPADRRDREGDRRGTGGQGEHQRLHDIRMFFQYATEAKFCDTVEQITGRKVRAFVSGIDTRRDVSSEVFYLEPSSSNGGAA
jgi:hypothetical protein